MSKPFAKVSEDDPEKAQEKAYRALERHAKAIARDCEMVSWIWDGNCGYIFERVREHLLNAGLYKVEIPSKPKKEKIGPKIRKEVFERDKYRCVECGSHLSLEADHIFPESLGGETVLDNLQTLCKPCNCKKSNKVFA